MTSPSVVASVLSTSRVFTTRGISRSTGPAPARRGASADPSRSLVTARVVSARPPSAGSASGDDADADGRYSGEPILFRFGDDGEPVAAETSSIASFENAASERESWSHVDDAGAESAVEVLRGPDGNLLFRFTGDAREEFEAAAAQADQPIAGDHPAEEMTQAQKAQALLDEAAALIERAKAIQNGDEGDLAAAAKAAAETLVDPNLDGTVIMRRSAAPAAVDRSNPAGAIARVSQLGIKAVVDGIENMFSNFRKSPVAQSVRQAANPVRLPKAPKDSPWAGKSSAANVSVDAAFDTFGADAADAAGDGLLFVADAADPEAALAEAAEEEHAAWEAQAARALEKGSVEALESRPEEALELASERYGDMGSVVAGLWRPKPVDVTIGGREFVAYITPNNLKQLPSGEYVVSEEEEEGESVPGDRVGEETTIILAEKQPDGTNVFMFGLTRTVLADGSVLYRFPSGETLG